MVLALQITCTEMRNCPLSSIWIDETAPFTESLTEIWEQYISRAMVPSMPYIQTRPAIRRYFGWTPLDITDDQPVYHCPCRKHSPRKQMELFSDSL